ncbi:Mpo1 family 2-hydroxy fatty acid dioxygenase [Rubrivivax gelatinosus]|uniref:Membrane protein YGL010W n=1 Tax=Rubrivivax gelatinosus (strain NBRC 100245 / IL144) TaxID=983917 RepID=I0HVF9_RUBGI|nr:Mpo1-like protein [Rubrivivax gelatinosus]MBG6078927.1 putative membrane protein YGL010W [Rubrivivax gelatinosus]BAL96996.1 hypothetical protein RGE_36570 [Rubrivivax gelatinosus IL144]
MSSPFRPAIDLLAQYARYHRDERNIATHVVGVPLIVFSIGVLLGRHGVRLGGHELAASWLLFAPAALWYLTRGEFALGLAVSAAIAALLALAQPLADAGTLTWLVLGAGGFFVGWTIQFLGHYYEGRKPAFGDDLVGLLVGPMFVAMEVLAMAGWFKPLVARVESRVGPTFVRDLAHPAT